MWALALFPGTFSLVVGLSETTSMRMSALCIFTLCSREIQLLSTAVIKEHPQRIKLHSPSCRVQTS